MHSLNATAPPTHPWNLDHELDFPNLFSAMQLSLVAFAAFLLALKPPTSPHIPRLPLRAYWLFVTVVFPIFAADESWYIKDYTNAILYWYIPATFIIFSGLVFLVSRHWQSPKQGFPLLISLAGFALLGFATIGIDTLHDRIALDGGDLRPSEEILEFLGELLMFIGILTYSLHSIRSDERRSYSSLMIIGFIVFALPFAVLLRQLEPLYAYISTARVTSVQFAEQTVELSGFTLSNHTLDPYHNRSQVDLFVKAKRPLAHDFGYTLQLIDQTSGQLLNSIDEWSDRRHSSFVPDRTYRYRQQFEDIDNTPANRALYLSLSLWWRDDDGNFHNYPISSSDQPLLSPYQVILAELIKPATDNPAPTSPPLATFDQGLTLQRADFPSQSPTGTTLNFLFTWSNSRGGHEDWTQFLHFFHEENAHFWNHDQPPLGPHLPTRLWYPDLSASETWQITLPTDLPPGRYQIYTGLYRHRDGARLPVFTADGRPLPQQRFPLGHIDIHP